MPETRPCPTHTLSQATSSIQVACLGPTQGATGLTLHCNSYQVASSPTKAAANVGLEHSFNKVLCSTNPVQVVASLSSQYSLSKVPPSPTEAASNCRSICSSHQTASSWAQMAADLGLHKSPSQEAPEPTHPVAIFRPHQNTTQPAPQMTHPKGGLSGHQSPAKATPVPYVNPDKTAVHCSHGQPSQPVSLKVSPTHMAAATETQLQQESALEAPGSGDQGNCIAGPYRTST